MLESFNYYKCKLSFVKNLIKLFKEIDMDGDGQLEFDEFLQFVLEYQNRLSIMNSNCTNKYQKIIEIYDEKQQDFDRLTFYKKFLENKNFSNFKLKTRENEDSFRYLLLSNNSKNIQVLNKKFGLMLSSKVSILLTSDFRSFDHKENILLVDYLVGLDYIILLTDKQLGIFNMK